MPYLDPSTGLAGPLNCVMLTSPHRNHGFCSGPKPSEKVMSSLGISEDLRERDHFSEDAKNEHIQVSSEVNTRDV